MSVVELSSLTLVNTKWIAHPSRLRIRRPDIGQPALSLESLGSFSQVAQTHPLFPRQVAPCHLKRELFHPAKKKAHGFPFVFLFWGGGGADVLRPSALDRPGRKRRSSTSSRRSASCAELRGPLPR